MFSLARVTLWNDGAFRRHVAFFQADEAEADLVCFFYPFVNRHLGKGTAVFGLVHLLANVALIR